MVFRDPLSTEDVPDEGGNTGPSTVSVVLWCACVSAGLWCWMQLAPEKSPPWPYEARFTPQVLASIRALPPEQQLVNVTVEPAATYADVVCETLEPLQAQIQYASVGGSQITTRFPGFRPDRLHVTTLEGLKADTEYRFQITTIDQAGLPRVARQGSFRTRLTDAPIVEPPPPPDPD